MRLTRIQWTRLLCVTAVAGAAARGFAQDPARDLAAQAWQLEQKGDAAQAIERLSQIVAEHPNDPGALRAYAEFLDDHRDPGARAEYEKLAALLKRTGAAQAQRAAVERRLAILDLLEGDRAAAQRHIEAYRAEGGSGLAFSSEAPPPAPLQATIQIPGPLRSFARMAALSPDLHPEDVLAAFGRNIVTNGYQAANTNEALEQTEYLKLVVRYLSQARELDRLAGEKKVIEIPACDSTQTADVLRVIGYRMRGGCGSDLVLETVNASRAFLTIDSGFPLAELEQALRTDHPFKLDYHPAQLPILYTVDYWTGTKDKTPQTDFMDFFISDPSVCRLYVALSKLDPETADALRASIPAARLKVYAHVLDFFGGMFQIRGGKAVVPGGARSEKAWSDLAGASTDKGAVFFEKMLARDDGWLASYYDALARINGPVRDYLTEPERLKRFYAAIRGRVTSPGPARPVFRANTDMLLMTTRLRLDPDGKPHLPGGLEVWKNLFVNHPAGKFDAKLTRSAQNWRDADDVLEALYGMSRKAVENEPLKIFMALSDVERHRTAPLETGTVERMAKDFHLLRAQYAMFSEAPSISDQTILQFIDTVHGINQIHDPALKADAAGTMQALTGLWQIFVRQGSIASPDASLGAIVTAFAKIQNDRDLFDAGRGGVNTLFSAANSPAGASAQDRMMDLLAGAGSSGGSDAHQQVTEELITLFEAQKLISLSSLFDLADNLEGAGRGEKVNLALAQKLVSRMSEIQLPRTTLSTQERNSFSYGYWSEHHVEAERKLNLRAMMEKASSDPQKLKDLRGLLAPFLRDTLVGFNYIHYAPPGAQVLHTNPLFVRNHDFIGVANANETWKDTEVFGSGWPANAGGRLVGSLAALPYALAEAEQNFLIPTREQALIWGDLVPQMILTAVVPRWWNVTPLQLHWVGLHMAYGETLLAESALDADRRKQVLAELANHAAPLRTHKVEQCLIAADLRCATENVVPSEMYLLAADFSARDEDSRLAAEIRRIAGQSPQAVSSEAISHIFGTPKPTLANSYEPELLNLRTFPTLMGYSSRILAETWESNLLYYGALADRIHVHPDELNILVPLWTQQTVERIFATHLEDWPALLRSLRLVGEDVVAKARKSPAAAAADQLAGGLPH